MNFTAMEESGAQILITQPSKASAFILNDIKHSNILTIIVIIMIITTTSKFLFFFCFVFL